MNHPQFEQTLMFSQLTLGDWLALSKILGSTPESAFWTWVAMTKFKLSYLDLREWTEVGRLLDKDSSWVTEMYNSYK
jgi:hypothetical protein